MMKKSSCLQPFPKKSSTFSKNNIDTSTETEKKKNKQKKKKNQVFLEWFVEANEEDKLSRTKSLTDDDLEELKGCLDLGFGFKYDEIPELCNTLPALELCYSMSQKYQDKQHKGSDSLSDFASSASATTSIANWKIFSPGDDPEDVKARLKYWAQAVACTINNAGVSGIVVENADSYMEIIQNHVKENSQSEEKKEVLEKAEESEGDTYEWAEQCLETNYFGLKRVTEALIPLLLLSDSPRIVNVSSPMGMLKNLSNKWAIGVLSNVEELTVEKVDEVVSEYLKDRKEGSFVAKRWPGYFSAYKLSKAVVNGYTRILDKKYPQIITNAVDPGFVATELTHNLGHFTPEQGAECPVKLALLPKEGPSGLFWERHELGSY